jgi:hypothetical protein
MYDIAGRSHRDFNIDNPGILDSLMYLSYKGREISNQYGVRLRDKNQIHLL